MNPLAFVGIPDWRSALLAAAFTLPWLAWLARGRLRSRWLWLALALAALLFPLAIALVQVPLQSALGALWNGLLDRPTIQRYLLLIALPSLLVASAVQETAKLAMAIVGLRLSGERSDAAAGLPFGAAAGAGFGGFEAFWVFNQVFAVGWSFAMVQLQGPLAALPFVERFFTVPFHVASAALAGYGYATGRPWRYWLLAVALHTVANYAAVMTQAGLLSPIATEVWIGVVAAFTFGGAAWLQRRTARKSLPAA